MAALLAVDLGLRTGFAVYGDDGRLQRFGSRNLGTRTRLRGAVRHVLLEVPDLAWLFAEGDRQLALVWSKAAGLPDDRVTVVGAEAWRTSLLYPREQRSGEAAKATAGRLARRVVAWSGLSGPTGLRHDAAEAILLGLWAAVQVGWLPALPEALRQG